MQEIRCVKGGAADCLPGLRDTVESNLRPALFSSMQKLSSLLGTFLQHIFHKPATSSVLPLM